MFLTFKNLHVDMGKIKQGCVVMLDLPGMPHHYGHVQGFKYNEAGEILIEVYYNQSTLYIHPHNLYWER